MKGSGLFREHLGEVLRVQRSAQQRTLRDVAAAANVSLGYLSEVERGQKEASSELIHSICVALGLPLWQLMRLMAHQVSVAEARGTA